jgi:hypothetical protein
MVWERQDSIMASTKRHPFVMRYRTGARRDGTIVAQDVDIIGDAGAYPYLSPRVLFAACVTASGPYRVPNVRHHARAVFTNNAPTSAFRGFGAMQVTFGYEQQMDPEEATSETSASNLGHWPMADLAGPVVALEWLCGQAARAGVGCGLGSGRGIGRTGAGAPGRLADGWGWWPGWLVTLLSQ